MVVRVPELLAHVLRNPKAYPGPHNQPQERTSKGYQKLDPNRQLKLIWDGVIARLNELLIKGKSVNVPNLGAFSFVNVLHEQRYGADKVGRKPSFIPSNELKYACPNYNCKEELNVSPDALTSAQSLPNKVMVLNEVPIAAGCYYSVDIVRSAVRQIFSAIVDLAERGYELDLEMGDVKLIIHNRNVQAKFSDSCVNKLQVPISIGSFHSGTDAKENLSGAPPRLSETWKRPEYSQAMSELLERPHSAEVHKTRVAVANLAVMSKDLTTCQ